jgi:hypothetical protein
MDLDYEDFFQFANVILIVGQLSVPTKDDPRKYISSVILIVRNRTTAVMQNANVTFKNDFQMMITFQL